MSNALARICLKTVFYTTLARKILCAQNPHFLKLGQFQTDLSKFGINQYRGGGGGLNILPARKTYCLQVHRR